MAETIRIDVPRAGLGDDLTEALAAQGLEAKLVEDDGDRIAVEVRFMDEQEQLLATTIHAIEGYLADRELPLLIQRAGDGAVVRPAGD
jgi:hypothetical protein